MIPEAGLILDAGTGLYRARDLICTRHLDILLSHVHLDHVIGLTFLFDILYEKTVDRITVHVAESKIKAIQEHLFAQDLFPVQPPFEIRPIKTTRPFTLNSALQVTPIPVVHPGGCYAFRLDGLPGGRSMAYVTDTTADSQADYVGAIRDVDTLIHECYFPDGWEAKAELTGHSCLTSVAQVARAAAVGSCYLVHINPLNDGEVPLDLTSAKTIFNNIQVPSDQQIIDL